MSTKIALSITEEARSLHAARRLRSRSFRGPAARHRRRLVAQRRRTQPEVPRLSRTWYASPEAVALLMPNQAVQAQHRQQFLRESRQVMHCRNVRGDRRTALWSRPDPGRVQVGTIFERRYDPQPTGNSLGYGNFSNSDILRRLRAAAGPGQRRARSFLLTK